MENSTITMYEVRQLINDNWVIVSHPSNGLKGENIECIFDNEDHAHDHAHILKEFLKIQGYPHEQFKVVAVDVEI